MITSRKRVLSHILISILLIFNILFATSCVWDPDKAVNIKDCFTDKIEVRTDSTLFYFYYNSEDHKIDDYKIIRVNIEYYVDYNTFMKKKNFFFFVPDDVKYEEQQPYITAEIGDTLTNQSVVYVSIVANYKTENENKSRFWIYVLAVIIALVMLIVFCSVYMVMCETFDSNSLLPSLMWFGGLIIYAIVTFVIATNWGSGPGGVLIGSAVLYFLCTLISFFKYKV